MVTPIFLVGYDTEQPTCIPAVRSLVGIHQRLKIPATFFLVGKLLEYNRTELRELLSNDLFEVASHTYSHCHLESASRATCREELQRTRDLIQDVFGRPVKGFRTPGGLEKGYKGDSERLGVFADTGLAYISSQGRGPGNSMPAPIISPYNYRSEGFPQLLEIPFHGWHENLLTGVHPWQSPDQPLSSEAPKTVSDWMAPFMADIEFTINHSFPYYSPTLHPWSLRRFNPECRQIEAFLLAVKDRGFNFMTFTDFAEKWAAGEFRRKD